MPTTCGKSRAKGNGIRCFSSIWWQTIGIFILFGTIFLLPGHSSPLLAPEFFERTSRGVMSSDLNLHPLLVVANPLIF